MKKVFCFGEILLRFSPNLQKQWIEEHTMPVFVGGAELNVAKALAAWKQPVRYVSALPDNYISKEIIDALKEEGIESSAMLFTGDRIGTYTLPMGADLKNAGVIYDRAYSSFSFLQPGRPGSSKSKFISSAGFSSNSSLTLCSICALGI